MCDAAAHAGVDNNDSTKAQKANIRICLYRTTYLTWSHLLFAIDEGLNGDVAASPGETSSLTVTSQKELTCRIRVQFSNRHFY